MICDDVAAVAGPIAEQLSNSTVAYTVIDPEGLQGLTWAGVSPLLCVKGDAMLIWFEMETWRLKQAAISDRDHPSAEADARRLDELYQSEQWMEAEKAEDLTDLFCDQVLEKCDKQVYSTVRIPRSGGNYYQPILFTGQFNKAEKLAHEWSANLDRRIHSLQGRSIDKLLDVKAGRCSSLDEFL